MNETVSVEIYRVCCSEILIGKGFGINMCIHVLHEYLLTSIPALILQWFSTSAA